MKHPDDTTLQTWFDGALPEADRVALERHLADCARCDGTVRALQSLHGAVNAWADDAPADDLTDAIFAKIEAEQSEPAPAKVIPLADRRGSPMRRFAFPAIAVAAAALLALKITPARHGAQPARDGGVAVVNPQPVEVAPGTAQGGAEVTRVDVQGAQSYAVLEIPAVTPGMTTAVVWIQDAEQ